VLKERLLEQLVEVYLTKESWHRSKLTPEDARQYYAYMLENDRIIYAESEDRVVGYVEYWCLNEVQFNRFIRKRPFCVYEEDLTRGEVSYIMDIYIDKEYRNKWVIRTLKKEYFEKTKDCIWHTGEEVNHGRRLRIFNRR